MEKVENRIKLTYELKEEFILNCGEFNFKLEPNVRHESMHNDENYSPYDLSNYDSKVIKQMAKSIVNNHYSDKPLLDNPIKVYDGVVQAGNTRAITLANLESIVKEHDLDKEWLNKDFKPINYDNLMIQVIVLNRPLTRSEMLADNELRSDAHWTDKAVVIERQNREGVSLLEITRQLGISKKQVTELRNVGRALHYYPVLLKFARKENGLSMQEIEHFQKQPIVFQKLISDYLIENPDQQFTRSGLDNIIRWSTTKLRIEDIDNSWAASLKDRLLVIGEGMYKDYFIQDVEEAKEVFSKYLNDLEVELTNLHGKVNKIELSEWDRPSDIKNYVAFTETKECLDSKMTIVYKPLGEIQTGWLCKNKNCEVHGDINRDELRDQIEKKQERQNTKSSKKATLEALLQGFDEELVNRTTEQDVRACLLNLICTSFIERYSYRSELQDLDFGKIYDLNSILELDYPSVCKLVKIFIEDNLVYNLYYGIAQNMVETLGTSDVLGKTLQNDKKFVDVNQKTEDSMTRRFAKNDARYDYANQHFEYSADENCFIFAAIGTEFAEDIEDQPFVKISEFGFETESYLTDKVDLNNIMYKVAKNVGVDLPVSTRKSVNATSVIAKHLFTNLNIIFNGKNG